MPGRLPVLRDYEVLAAIGQGPLGTVYQALSRRDRGRVALKWVASDDPDLRQRWRRGVQATSRLAHPGLVIPLESGEQESALWTASELVDGRDLLSSLEPPIAEDPERVRHALYLFGQLLKALAYLHGEGLVHGGLKPANVLVTRSAQVRLTDAGLSRSSLPCTPGPGSGGGDPQAGFLAPETTSGRPLDGRTDLFAVGRLLHAALSGRPPQPDLAGALAGGELSGSSSGLLERAFEPLLARLSAKQPEQRPASALEVLREIKVTWELFAAQRQPRATAQEQGISPAQAPLQDDRARTQPLPVSADPARPGGVAAFPAEQPQPGPAAPAAAGAVFVGRSTELARLGEALERCLAGRGQAVAVTGETGVGKTRLLAAFATRLRQDGLDVIEVHGRGASGVARRPVAAVLDALAARLETWPEAERGQALPAETSALAEVSPAFARWMRPEPSPGDAEYAAARRKYKLRVALVKVLRILGARQPVVIVLDDLHESDQETFDLVWHAARHLYGAAPGQRARVLLVVSFRSDEIELHHPIHQETKRLAEDGLLERIALDRLAESGSAELVRTLLGIDAAPPELLSYLWNEARGHPMLLVEMVGLLREDGVIRYERGRIKLDAGALGRIALPSKGDQPFLDRVLRRRLQRLEPAAREVLQLAAVAGGELDAATLRQCALLPEPLEQGALAELVRCQVLLPLIGSPDSYTFAHGKVRQVVLADLEPARRRGLARGLALAREKLLGERRRERASELAQLFDEAGDRERTLAYLPAAAEAHFRDGDLRGSLSRWRRVAELVAGLEERQRATRTGLDLEARHKAARIICLLGQLDLARRSYAELAERAARAGQVEAEVDALNGIAEVCWKCGDYPGARKAAEQALETSRNRLYRAGEAAALENLGVVRRRTFEMKEAFQDFRDALRIRRALGDDVGVARLLSNLGLVYRNQDNHERARAQLNQAREIYERLGDRLGIAVTLSRLAGVCFRENAYSAAEELYREASRHDEEMGNSRGVALCSQGLGYLYLSEGDYRNALEHLERALRVFERVGDRPSAAWSLINLGHTYYRTGNHREAAKRYRSAIAVLGPVGNLVAESEARSGLALALFELGEKAEAVEAATAAVEAARARGVREKEAWARFTLAQVTSSLEQAERALALAEAVGSANLIFQIHHAMARLLLEHGERERAREHFQKAFTIIDSIAEQIGPTKDIFLRKPAVEAVFRDARRL